MKKSLFVAALTLAASTAVAAPPTVTFIKSLAIGGTTTAPTDIAIRNDKVYVAGFTNKVITEVTDILGAVPTVTNVIDVSAETTWDAGRGVQAITFDASGNLHIFGDTGGTANNGMWWIYNTSFVQTQELAANANRFDCGLILSNGNALVGRVASSTVQVIDGTGAQQSISNLPLDDGSRAAVRDWAQVGNSAFYITTNAIGHSIAKIADISDLSVAGDTATLVTNLGSTSAIAFVGLSTYTDGVDTWLVACDINDNEIDFVNSTTNATDLNYADATNITGNQGRSVGVGTIAGNTYMIVGSQSANTLLVYQLTSTSAVGEWTMYN